MIGAKDCDELKCKDGGDVKRLWWKVSRLFHR